MPGNLCYSSKVKSLRKEAFIFIEYVEPKFSASVETGVSKLQNWFHSRRYCWHLDFER